MPSQSVRSFRSSWLIEVSWDGIRVEQVVPRCRRASSAADATIDLIVHCLVIEAARLRLAPATRAVAGLDGGARYAGFRLEPGAAA